MKMYSNQDNAIFWSDHYLLTCYYIFQNSQYLLAVKNCYGKVAKAALIFLSSLCIKKRFRDILHSFALNKHMQIHLFLTLSSTLKPWMFVLCWTNINFSNLLSLFPTVAKNASFSDIFVKTASLGIFRHTA